jgi:hypothetical protein
VTSNSDQNHAVWKARTIQRLMQRRSNTQGSFGITTKKGTDLKGKRLFRPRWTTLKSLANVKGMDVILHGLCPVPINRWTVPLYCSRWLVLIFASRLYFHFLSSQWYECNSVLSSFIYDYIIRNVYDDVIRLFTLSLMFYMSHPPLIYLYIYICWNDEGISFITFVRRSLYP